MAISGLRHTDNFIANARPENWRETLLRLAPRSSTARKAVLTMLTSQMKSESTNDPKFHWFTKKVQTRRLKNNTTLNNTDAAGTEVTLTLQSGEDNAKSVKAGDILMVEDTEELLRVTTTPTNDTQITVSRGFAGSTISSHSFVSAGNNPFLIVVGNAYEENSMAPDPVQFDPTELENQTQIFRQTIGMSRSAIHTRTRTGPEWAEAKRECLEITGIDMERAFIWGKKSTTTQNGYPMRTTDGILSYIPAQNRLAAPSNQVTMDWFEQQAIEIFRYGSDEKVMVGGNRALTAINQAVRKNSSYEIVTGQTEFGIKVTRIITPHGELVFMNHPLFSEMSSGVTQSVAYNAWDANALVLDMAGFRYRYLEKSDLQWQDNLEQPGQDGKESGYIAECGLELHHPDTHFLLTGMVTGAADS